ncbi:hypothetical protein EDD86DRAFT_214623 [Gorgonomyces haynaldii]|nr:hypothetical protein EDD86DRAFT_214623 [Gorgonomyces haynaldii]
MALAYCKHRKTFESDITNLYFTLFEQAKETQELEYKSAIVIQKNWRGYKQRYKYQLQKFCVIQIQKVFRGYLGRVYALKVISENRREARTTFFSAMAVKIQKVWRAYRSRKYIFDYYRRKAYLQSIGIKAVEMRKYLTVASEKRHEAMLQLLKDQEQQKLERTTFNLHHLTSTKAVPGVAQEETVIGRTRIREQMVKHNPLVKKWIKEHIGINHKNVQLRPIQSPEEQQERVKLAQGPFMLKYTVERTKQKPLEPTLRVQTHFYDTRDAMQEQKRQELAQRGTASYNSRTGTIYCVQKVSIEPEQPCISGSHTDS